MVRQSGIMNGLGETVWDDEGAMVRQFGMMKAIRIKLLVFLFIEFHMQEEQKKASYT